MLRVKDMQMDIRDYVSYIISTSSMSVHSILAGVGITNYKGIYMSIEGGDIRWRADGSAPTATEGHMLYDTEDCEAYDPNMVFLGKLRLIRAGSTDVTVRISVY